MTSTASVELQGEVIKGFGRGSKELGIPTGMSPPFVLVGYTTGILFSIAQFLGCCSKLPRGCSGQPSRQHDARYLLRLGTGAFGCLLSSFTFVTMTASDVKQVNEGQVRMAVMSVGWNPFYKNTKRSAVR